MMDDIFVTESPQGMALGEAISWKFDFAEVGLADPSAVGTTVAYNESGADVSSTVLSGAASLSGSVVTGKKFTPTAVGRYVIVQPATVDGNTVFLACRFEVGNVYEGGG